MEQKIAVQKPSRISQRYEVIDTLRGISLVYMMICHILQFALIPESKWFWALTYIFIDSIGVPAFLFTSGFSLAISYNKKIKKGIKKGIPLEITYKKARNDTIFRGLILFSIGIFYNLGFAIIHNNPADIWDWLILQLIGLAQIATFYFRRLSTRWRFIVLGLVLFLSTPLQNLLYHNPDPTLNAIGYLLFHRIEMNPPLPFLFYSFLGTLIGDIMMKDESKKTNFKGLEFRIFMLISGAVLLTLGIIFGSSTLESNWTIDILIQTFNLPGLPYFLYRGSIPNVLYNSGVLLIITLTLNRYKIHSQHHTKTLNYFSILGKASLSLYLYHHLGIFFISRIWDATNVWIIISLSVGIFSIIFYVWYRKTKYKYGIEWGIERLRSKFFSKHFTYEKEIEEARKNNIKHGNEYLSSSTEIPSLINNATSGQIQLDKN